MDIDLLAVTTAQLRGAGCVAADEEAAELMEAAGEDAVRLAQLVARRCSGEPTAWLIGSVSFAGETVLVHPGVYVPRWQSEPLALEAAARLPDRGIAVDLCTGAGAIAVVLSRRRPFARVVATEIDPLAAACARGNGVEVFESSDGPTTDNHPSTTDMFGNLPEALAGQVDVVVSVVPYVPTDDLRLLPRDVLAYEPRHALDGGPDGTSFLRRAALDATRWLRPGGSLLLELGGDQADRLQPTLAESGYHDVELMLDEDGDLRAICCRH